MRALGVEESKLRKASAWAAEKVGRARMIMAGDEPAAWGCAHVGRISYRSHRKRQLAMGVPLAQRALQKLNKL